MSAQERLSGPFAGLNEGELEVLRLLAAGHTAKTIAHRLGRSETSINERLREARRKTGIGSSRELARLLDAQQFWDKKIDLPATSVTSDGLAQPATAGVKTSKGMIAMLIALSAAAAMIFTVVPSVERGSVSHAAAEAASKKPPFVGTWSLDVSRIPQEERPQRVTMTFRMSADRQLTTRVDIVAPDGVHRHAESTAALDGHPVAIAGDMDIADTVALRQPAPGTLVMTLGKKGVPLSTRVYAVARDRKSMTETIIWPGNDLPKLETTYFNRID
jgi:DNA-binding CsgD family transcriptional regulator